MDRRARGSGVEDPGAAARNESLTGDVDVVADVRCRAALEERETRRVYLQLLEDGASRPHPDLVSGQARHREDGVQTAVRLGDHHVERMPPQIQGGIGVADEVAEYRARRAGQLALRDSGLEEEPAQRVRKERRGGVEDDKGGGQAEGVINGRQ